MEAGVPASGTAYYKARIKSIHRKKTAWIIANWFYSGPDVLELESEDVTISKE